MIAMDLHLYAIVNVTRFHGQGLFNTAVMAWKTLLSETFRGNSKTTVIG